MLFGQGVTIVVQVRWRPLTITLCWLRNADSAGVRHRVRPEMRPVAIDVAAPWTMLKKSDLWQDRRKLRFGHPLAGVLLPEVHAGGGCPARKDLWQ